MSNLQKGIFIQYVKYRNFRQLGMPCTGEYCFKGDHVDSTSMELGHVGKVVSLLGKICGRTTRMK